jgi:hemerythrin-like domain-containing protein
MKATKLLVQQHDKVKKALGQLAEGKGDLAATLKEVADDLAAHMAIEQQLFYPTVLSVKRDLVNESYEEHSVAELALKRLLRTPPQEELFKARATVLKELIEHHVKEEEEELFPAVEKALSAETLEGLGTKMEMLFKDCKAQGFEAMVPSGFAKTSADEFERAVGAR